MPKYEKMEDLPPKIQEALKRKGWSWPPSEKELKEREEAAKRLAGSIYIDPDILKEIYREMGWTWHGSRKT